ncbi:Exodeoxyribonuclease III [hydrothermal vent metagenome]|uniref:Exodeoxyribonuclease III n=1 Tax=hydrothermal vent metagenome TaxID=652676 RepID=A0A3B0Y7C6_9ZZZZ
MKVISLNANGIRAATRKGFFDWMKRQQAQVICIQETKAWREQLEDPIYWPKNWHGHFVDASKKGYSGVAIYSRIKPDKIIEGIGWDAFDSEGRYLQFDFGKLSVISIYLPSGSSKESRQHFKYEVLDRLGAVLKTMRRKRREYILCGDWNIAHKKIDIKNWRGNQKNSGFLPEERAWMDHLFDQLGYIDAFRQVNQKEEQYTWWSSRGQAWANNVGWRIDYQITTPGIGQKAIKAGIYTAKRFSDHAPLSIEYDWKIGKN